MKTKAPLILASGSPRRQQLLRDAGFDFEVLVRPVYEYIPEHIHPRAVAVMLSEHKAKAYDDRCGDSIVITADTLVAIEDQILGKPADKAEAVSMLQRLSGRSHAVYTGVSLFHQGRFRSFVEETLVTFRRLKDSEILHYVDTFAPMDKAGAYGIQEWIGMVGITRIEGDYYNVMGLPVARFYTELAQF
ncbi:MAG: Maf family protein [Bacteroidia bacterium]